MGNLSFASDPTVDGIRCVGNFNRDKQPAMPRSHHKFLVFSRVLEHIEDDIVYGFEYYPEAVWTGSFNFTKNALMSFENAVYFSDKSGNRKAALLVASRLYEQGKLSSAKLLKSPG